MTERSDHLIPREEVDIMPMGAIAIVPTALAWLRQKDVELTMGLSAQDTTSLASELARAAYTASNGLVEGHEAYGIVMMGNGGSTVLARAVKHGGKVAYSFERGSPAETRADG